MDTPSVNPITSLTLGSLLWTKSARTSFSAKELGRWILALGSFLNLRDWKESWLLMMTLHRVSVHPKSRQNSECFIRVYAQNQFYAIIYAIRQLACTPWLYVIFRTCAQITTILRHSHIKFKPSQLLQFNNNWRLYESRVNLNKRSVVKLSLYKSLALTICI